MDESFLPYAMLEPLLEPGMTGWEFGNALAARLSLDTRIYGAVYVEPGPTFAASLRGGIRIVKKTSDEFLTAPKFKLRSLVR